MPTSTPTDPRDRLSPMHVHTLWVLTALLVMAGIVHVAIELVMSWNRMDDVQRFSVLSARIATLESRLEVQPRDVLEAVHRLDEQMTDLALCVQCPDAQRPPHTPHEPMEPAPTP